MVLSGTMFSGAPPDNGLSGFEWGGEWTLTYETFRDMGLAFGVALVLSYMLVVGEFDDFVAPAVIVAPIPMILLGIVPGHWIMGADFIATFVIGFIAPAGIVVRGAAGGATLALRRRFAHRRANDAGGCASRLTRSPPRPGRCARPGSLAGGLSVSPLRRALWSRVSARERAAIEAVAALPAYQVALWPDGWELSPDGSVSVRDTHAMAEARRWYALARRNRAGWVPGPALAMHGVFIPPAILDLARRTFVSEQVASVAVQLVAGDWVGQRRARLLRTARAAIGERARAWTGSRHGLDLDARAVRALVADLLGLCVCEGLIPRADYGVKVRRDDGFGVCGYRVRVETPLEPDARARVGDALTTALIPWNRAVGRDTGPSLVISVEVAGRQARYHDP